MNQIYDFQKAEPPVLTEARLRAELERRRLRRETALVTLAAILTQLCLVVLSVVLYPVEPALSFVCAVYVCLSASGGGVLALVFAQKRRFLVP